MLNLFQRGNEAEPRDHLDVFGAVLDVMIIPLKIGGGRSRELEFKNRSIREIAVGTEGSDASTAACLLVHDLGTENLERVISGSPVG